jgi:hypothetical protein
VAGRSQPSSTPSHAPTARGGPQPPAGARLNPTCGPEAPTPRAADREAPATARAQVSVHHHHDRACTYVLNHEARVRKLPRTSASKLDAMVADVPNRASMVQRRPGPGRGCPSPPPRPRTAQPRLATGRLRPIQRGVRLLQQLLGRGLLPGRRPPSPGAPRQHATRSASGMTSPPPPVHDRRPPARSGGAAPAIPARTPRPVAVDIAHGQTAMTGGGALPPHARQRRVAHAVVVDHQRVPLARGGGHRVLGQQPHPPVVEHLVIQSPYPRVTTAVASHEAGHPPRVRRRPPTGEVSPGPGVRAGTPRSGRGLGGRS